jgi:hypothetical protein
MALPEVFMTQTFTIGLEPEWSIGSSVQLSLAYEYNHVNFS